MKVISNCLRALVLSLLLVSCERINPDDNNQSKEPIVTEEATDVTMGSAILHGIIRPDYLTPDAQIGFIISTNSNPSIDNGKVLTPVEIDQNNHFFVTAKGLSYLTTYYFKAYVKNDSYIVGEIKQFKTKEFEFEAIDIGLSVKWGNANIGATAPDECGYFYAWGETEVKDDYTWQSYKWNQMTKYNTIESLGGVDNKINLDIEDDVASAQLGGKWRMPTVSEAKELIDTKSNSSYDWTIDFVNGYYGYTITYLVNGNSIFLPAAGYRSGKYYYSRILGMDGYYWTSSLNTDTPNQAYYLGFYSGNVYCVGYSRECGLLVRPVSD